MPTVPEERAALLRWYARHRRPLPWRQRRDPYAIWVSEVMLQQTRVETVVDYWERFLRRFPSVEALAAAGEDEVLSAWSGLGYYRRARALHAAAREVVGRYGGALPSEPQQLAELPGFGPYTVGAVASIAFGRPEPAIDGNVSRVLCRLRGIETPLGRAVTRRALRAAAEALLQGCPQPGELNQALMELGATCCTPRRPDCPRCPLREGCVGRASGDPERLPLALPRRRPTEERWVALLAFTQTDGGPAVWLERSEGSRFGGLWGPPMRPLASARQGSAAARALAEQLGARRPRVTALEPLRHVLTHRTLLLSPWRLRAPLSRPATPSLRAVPLAELADLGLSTLARRLLASARRDGQPGT